MSNLVLLSGGIDSLVVAKLAQLAAPSEELVAFHVRNVGHQKSEQAARESARILDCRFEVLTQSHRHGMWYENTQGTMVHPMGNIMVHMDGFQYAVANGMQFVYSGLKADNNNEEWLTLLETLLYSAVAADRSSRPRPVILRPLKDEPTGMDAVVAKAAEFGLSLDHTWSCSQFPACKKCGRCRDRERLGLPT